MPRFYFHLQDGPMDLQDDEPLEFQATAGAEQHARTVADEYARNKSPSELKAHFIVVKDSSGAQVVRLPVGKRRARATHDKDAAAAGCSRTSSRSRDALPTILRRS